MRTKSENIVSLASEALQLEDYQRCYEYSIEAIKEDSSNDEAWGYKGISVIGLGDFNNIRFKEAFSLFNTACIRSSYEDIDYLHAEWGLINLLDLLDKRLCDRLCELDRNIESTPEEIDNYSMQCETILKLIDNTKHRLKIDGDDEIPIEIFEMKIHSYMLTDFFIINSNGADEYSYSFNGRRSVVLEAGKEIAQKVEKHLASGKRPNDFVFLYQDLDSPISSLLMKDY